MGSQEDNPQNDLSTHVDVDAAKNARAAEPSSSAAKLPGQMPPQSRLPGATALRLAAVAIERADASNTKNALLHATGHVRIGDLLMYAGLVSFDFIQTALSNFEDLGLPLGKVLIKSGYVTELQLRSALDIQTLVNDRQLPLEVGIKVLTMAFKDKVPLSDAFESSGVVQPEDHLSNKLGQLLIDAHVLDMTVLEQALDVNQRTGLPLGHILCYRGVISQQLLETALLGQQLVRRGSIKREQCISAIAQSNLRELALEKLPVNIGFKRSMLRSSPRIGELLFEAELISDGELLESLQTSLAGAKSSGKAMTEVCGMKRAYIDATVELQEMIDNGMFNSALASDTYVRMKEFDQNFARASAEASVSRILLNPSKKMLALLRETGLLTAAENTLPVEVQERLEVNYNQSIELSKALVSANLVTAHAVYSALRAIYLLETDYLTEERAVLALDMAVRENILFDEAVFRLGWKQRTRLRDS